MKLRLLPWLTSYRTTDLWPDLLSGGLTATLLIPQALAYAFLAGLPPQVGLYAALLPPLAYALLGSSRHLAVGPTAIVAIMSAEVIADTGDPTATAVVLAFMVGVFMLILSAVRAGFLVNFISFPVLSGFSAGAALTIIFSQLGNFSGLAGHGSPDHWHLSKANLEILTVSLPVLALMLAARGWRPRWISRLRRLRLTARMAARAAPLLALVAAALACRGLHIDIPTVGAIPQGLPVWHWPRVESISLRQLAPHAALIALVAYLESISVAQMLARRERERLQPNRELAAVGLGNIGAALLGGMPVAGSFSRSAINFSAGSRSPLSGVVCATLVALAISFATTLLHDLPVAALAAVIIAASVALIEPQAFWRAWRYDRAEGIAWLAAALGVVVLGVEGGLLLGVAINLLVDLYRASRPHIAELGRVPRSQQYRELQRYPDLETWPQLLILRVDENLFFGNAREIGEDVAARVVQRPSISAVILACGGVNSIDVTALEMIEELAETMRLANVELHLAEVKPRLQDRLEQTRMTEAFGPRKIHASVELAIVALASPPI